MKNDIASFHIFQKFIEIITELYRLGWDERNGGNISYLLYEDEVAPYLKMDNIRHVGINFDASDLKGKYFLITGSGKYFRNVEHESELNLGIIKIAEDGISYDIVWGFIDGGIATSELATHLMNHRERLKQDSHHRVIMHCHATNLIAMTFTHDLDEIKFTRKLWEMISECIIVFPEGIGLIPWRVPGTDKIGEETAEKMKYVKLVIWPHHGVFASGVTLDETFGLIETAEKAATIYSIVCQQGGKRQSITRAQLKKLADTFHITPREGIL